MTNVVMRNPQELLNHPVNIELYGEHIPEDLQTSISSHGVEEPLIVCRSSLRALNNFVVSGRRRRIAAIVAGIKQVPTIEWPCESEPDFIRKLITHNIRAELTNEQRLRMFAKLRDVESQLAEIRMKAGRAIEQQKRVGPVASSPSESVRSDSVEDPVEAPPEPVHAGRASEIAAKEVGLSRSTAEAGLAVIERIDNLKASGKTDEAESLTETLNNRIHAAVRVVNAPKPRPKPLPPPPPQKEKACPGCQSNCNEHDNFCFNCGEELPSKADQDDHRPPGNKYIRAIDRKVRSIVKHWGQFAINRDKLIKDLDAANSNVPAFSTYFKKYESIMTIMCDNCDVPGEQVNLLSNGWVNTRKKFGEG